MTHTPGTRYDFRTGQYFPQLDGKDTSPSSFDESRALVIATECAEQDYERRVQAYEDQGMTRSDAQGVVEAEDMQS